jgi:hypothetical protein
MVRRGQVRVADPCLEALPEPPEYCSESWQPWVDRAALWSRSSGGSVLSDSGDSSFDWICRYVADSGKVSLKRFFSASSSTCDEN